MRWYVRTVGVRTLGFGGAQPLRRYWLKDDWITGALKYNVLLSDNKLVFQNVI